MYEKTVYHVCCKEYAVLKSSKNARRCRKNVEAEAREKEHVVKRNNVSDAGIQYEDVL